MVKVAILESLDILDLQSVFQTFNSAYLLTYLLFGFTDAIIRLYRAYMGMSLMLVLISRLNSEKLLTFFSIPFQAETASQKKMLGAQYRDGNRPL